MSSKLDYLKRYMSPGDGDGGTKPKKKVRRKKAKGLIIVDDNSAAPLHGNYDSDDDASPTRKGVRRGNSSSDASPPRRRRGRKDSDSDASPPRRKRNAGDSDASPPRRGRRRHSSDGDASPPRKKRNDSDSDASPPRRQLPASGGPSTGRPTSAGPRSRSALGGSGGGGENKTVFRDKKTGKKLDVALEKKRKRAEEDAKAAELEKQMEWGRGLVQKQQASDKIEDMLHEMNKPLARYRDDSDLDKMLRDEDREGDPMLAFMKKKKKKVDPSKPVRPVWQGQCPPNRFNIRPGYRWDGVDRSNGFEKKCFMMQANRKVTAEEAYQWSVEDM